MYTKEENRKMRFETIAESKKRFLESRTFFERLSDSRQLLNRKLWYQDKPLLENVSEGDFDKIKKVLDDLQSQGIIKDWIIGGGTALMYYTDAVPTIDIDIFSYYTSASFMRPFGDLYEYLSTKYGAVPQDEMIKVGNLYLQFLPTDSTNPVDEEAVKHPNIIKHGLRIFQLEYLICSMLYLGLPKYVKRLETIKAENKYDFETLKELLKKFRLEKKWDKI